MTNEHVEEPHFEKKISLPIISEAMSLGIIVTLCQMIQREIDCVVYCKNGDTLVAKSSHELDQFTEQFVIDKFNKLKMVVMRANNLYDGCIEAKVEPSPVAEPVGPPVGATRENHHLPSRTDIMMPWAEDRLGKVNAEGNGKYGRYDFTLGERQSAMLNHAMDHLYSWTKGIINPSAATGEDDLAKAVWNLRCVLDQDERLKLGFLPAELNDLCVSKGAKK
jgi:hypothetical protein